MNEVNKAETVKPVFVSSITTLRERERMRESEDEEAEERIELKKEK